jgi:dTMP kinase
MFITFEGVEGCGKTTQIAFLESYLKNKGHQVVRTREPGGTALGEALRKILLHQDLHVLPFSELLVLMAVRTQHMEELIMPALNEGKIVLCDRFMDASYAYQGYGRGIDLGIIQTLNRYVTKGITPNLTFLLDCPADTGLKRKRAQDSPSDRFEDEALSFHEKIRQGYLNLARNDQRFFVIDAKQDMKTIEAVIKEKVDKLLEGYGV